MKIRKTAKINKINCMLLWIDYKIHDHIKKLNKERRREKEKGKSVLLTMHKERLHQDLIGQLVAASADTQKIYEILWNFEIEKINITENKEIDEIWAIDSGTVENEKYQFVNKWHG